MQSFCIEERGTDKNCSGTGRLTLRFIIIDRELFRARVVCAYLPRAIIAEAASNPLHLEAAVA